MPNHTLPKLEEQVIFITSDYDTHVGILSHDPWKTLAFIAHREASDTGSEVFYDVDEVLMWTYKPYSSEISEAIKRLSNNHMKSKTIGKQELIKTIRSVMSGKTIFTHVMWKRLKRGYEMHTDISFHPESWVGYRHQRHCCNEISRSEVITIIDRAEPTA
jgi:hypothetical protein